MATLIETNTTPRARADVDPVTLDIIENALRNARYEMDAVLFRTAMSPGIREQHDEFPLIADPTGKMVVGQFGLSIPDFLAGFDGTIEDGDVLHDQRPVRLRRGDQPRQRLAGRPADLPRWSRRRLVRDVRSHDRRRRQGARHRCRRTPPRIFEEGVVIPPFKLYKKGEHNDEALRLDPQPGPDEGLEPV